MKKHWRVPLEAREADTLGLDISACAKPKDMFELIAEAIDE